MRVAAIVLAAGAASRFGGGKLLATVGGRAVLSHVLDALAGSPVDDIVVVLGSDADAIEAAIPWRGERRVRNPRPQDGLASSLRVGLDAVAEDPAGASAVLVVLGDQPALRPETVARLVDEAGRTDRPIVRPRYAADAAPNPVLLRRGAWALAAGLEGDRGLGPLLAARPDLVHEVPVPGAIPDIDTRRDLATLLESDWARRVRENREQVERVRERADGPDFYRPVTATFIADPRRADDPALDALRALARPDDTWLDVGAGAGRYALPLALVTREVIALDPSPGMIAALRSSLAEHGIDNVRVVMDRWPPEPGGEAAGIRADVALIAHVSYDIEHIGPFVDALETAARRLVVALLMDRAPAAQADEAWEVVHGEPRVRLPAMNELVELLRARGRSPEVRTLTGPRRAWESRAELLRFLRRQTWVEEGSAKDRRLADALDALVEEVPDGVVLRNRHHAIRLATWEPART